MSEVNVAVFGGRLTEDPVVCRTESDKVVSNFTLSSKKNKDVEPMYVDVVAWNRCAENCVKYLKKGSRVVVHGYLNQSRWIDKTGQKRSKLELIANTVHFISLGDENESE